jgi:enterochelin esterase family protein
MGSYPAVLRGEKGLPQLVRANEQKPLRIVFQDGAQDKSSPEWGVGAARHKDIVAALKAKGYDYKYVLGKGGHDGTQAGAIFPHVMRWLWRDYPR